MIQLVLVAAAILSSWKVLCRDLGPNISEIPGRIVTSLVGERADLTNASCLKEVRTIIEY